MKLPILTIVISVTSLALFFLFGAIPENLIWHHTASGELRIWQWFSAHFSHISIEHLFMNVAAFAILGGFIEQHCKTLLVASLAVGIIAVNVYLLSGFSLPAYAGMSGILNALLVVALYVLYKDPNYRAAALITFVASVMKIVFEHYFHISVFSNLPWPAVPLAHLAGMAGGLIFIIALEFRRRVILNSALVSFS